ncbi:MAG: ferritin-like domain-containing protein [Myxococcota bacterium]|nr:ferritin-like domain-containing protein [Myxococcota bacterium]
MDRLRADRPIETTRVPQDVTYNWEYDNTRAQLERLYQHAKRDQWDGDKRLDWSTSVDPNAELVPDAAIGIWGTPMWDKLTKSEIEKLRHEAITWQLCQFLHGEQGALLATAQIVDSVPWYEAKMYGSTQVMDEARHVEVYRRYVQEKLEHDYPVNPNLKKLLDQILSDSRWDMKFLGMQIIVEGLALAAFGTIRDSANEPLLKELVAAVMEDESRHVAFGVISLREHMQSLGEAEKKEREDFVYEACVLMRDRILNHEVWESMGMPVEACVEASLESPFAKEYRRRLFKKIVPNVKSLGLLSDRQRERFADLGVLEFESGTTSDIDQAIEEERRRQAGLEREAA